jgi:light-regulated signal transduction histidine kinase (bacteriophytochrome)
MDLLNRAQIGSRDMVREGAHLDAVVREVSADRPPEADGREVEWRIQPLPEAECHPGLLKLVFSNRLSNAAKSTRLRLAAVTEIGTCRANGTIAFPVRDNGVGFDTKSADKLFGVFRRLPRQEDLEGTGTGLATVERTIHRRGGEIWDESEPGRGAAFFFTLEDRPGDRAIIRSERGEE